ncbi:hypothetical protein EWM62_02030 [Mucilaginibacter terrigena]|uniref:Uncharacterized protein n=1 Tax=Mucilaginibacter terrigena TaxID=2492395 RepID=A0A4Q5LRQ2_9SPHI|nr:hypothetical protein [Mucilaginibacter terrigena]RYU92236.1 hypothetical protein EWM62_02030 [Mucilaginibacter terrigena]
MKYGENFEQFAEALERIDYKESGALSELQRFIESVIAFIELTGKKDDLFLKSVDHYKRQFEIDLSLVKNALNRQSKKGKEEGFHEAKKQTDLDLGYAATRFMGW